jgi:signal transduction histidine kinase
VVSDSLVSRLLLGRCSARIARDLHDTLLQTVQGSKLVASNALKNTDDPVRTRRALEQVSEWLIRATEEGRAALHSLRTSTIETNDLAAGLQRALEDCRREPSMETVFNVSGNAREMHPIVRDEIYLIGYEAIRNAHSHSAGSLLDVTLTYAEDLSLSVRDNGIGIDSATSTAGKDGHFGLPSVRERATRIGGRLTIETSANHGTEVKIVIPGSLAFSRPRPSPFDKVKTLFDWVNKN